tara:strand:+ start:2169 stop:2366 length:198 start_codon:yes stop_codon:yes gene_type:complete
MPDIKLIRSEDITKQLGVEYQVLRRQLVKHQIPVVRIGNQSYLTDENYAKLIKACEYLYQIPDAD